VQTGGVKIPTLTVLLLAIVALVVLGAVVHVLGGITKLLVVIVVVLGVAIWIRNSVAKRRAQ
jgi:Flp pilus assembly protein TadB